MKLKLKNVWTITIVLIVFVLIFTSKIDYYKNDLKFYNNDIRGVITKIVETRGTKIYYSESDFFYLSQLNGKLVVGDSISKKSQSDLKIFKNNKNDEYLLQDTIKVKKPSSNYFEYFFGI